MSRLSSGARFPEVETVWEGLLFFFSGLNMEKKPQSMDWFKGQFAGNHGFPNEIWGFPVNFPWNQSIDSKYQK